MKGYERIEAIISQAHAETVPINTNPVIALIARSAQDMRGGDCQVTIGSGESTYEAINDALTKAGKMKDWVVVVSQLGEDGNHIMPPIMCNEPMRTLRKSGLNAVFYIKESGEWEAYNPTT